MEEDIKQIRLQLNQSRDQLKQIKFYIGFMIVITSINLFVLTNRVIDLQKTIVQQVEKK